MVLIAAQVLGSLDPAPIPEFGFRSRLLSSPPSPNGKQRIAHVAKSRSSLALNHSSLGHTSAKSLLCLSFLTL